MSTRARQSTVGARQSTVGPSGTAAAHELPPYEPPENPLNIDGQRALRNILKDHQHQKLEQHLRQAAQALGDNANTLNYRLTERRARDLKRRDKYSDSLTDVDEQRHAHLQEFDVKVTAMTKRMEEAVRKVIDGQSFAGALQEELAHVERLAVDNASASQRMATQTQTQQQQHHDDSDDDEMTEYDPTLPGETQRSGGGAVQAIVPRDVFEERYQAQRDKYQGLSLPIRYSEHPDYVGFKKAVHDGTYPNGEGPPLAPASAWFTSAGAPAPGVTQAGAAGGGNDSDDDDIAIAYERISTKCPLTLQELREPITSTKCPHTFEKHAIAEMLQRSNAWTGGNARRGARDGVKTVQCPMSGCDKMLTHNDLRPDASIIRKIRRIQQKRMEEDSDDEGVDNSHVQVIPSGDVNEDGYDDIDEASQRIVPKVERFSGVSGRLPPRAESSESRGGGGGAEYDGTMESTMQSTMQSSIMDMESGSDDDDE